MASDIEELEVKLKKAQAGDLDKISLGVELDALKRKNQDLEKDLAKKNQQVQQLNDDVARKEKERAAIEDAKYGTAQKDLEAKLAKERLQAELDDLKKRPRRNWISMTKRRQRTKSFRQSLKN